MIPKKSYSEDKVFGIEQVNIDGWVLYLYLYLYFELYISIRMGGWRVQIIVKLCRPQENMGPPYQSVVSQSYEMCLAYFALYYGLSCTLLRLILRPQLYFTSPYITVSVVLYLALYTASVSLHWLVLCLKTFFYTQGGWPPITHKAIILPTTLQCI